MYNLVKLNGTVIVKPKEISSNLGDLGKILKKGIYTNYEKKILLDYDSYLVKIVNIDLNKLEKFSNDKTDNGIINEINGNMTFTIEYNAVVFEPIKGSVFDVIVSKCSKVGFWGHPLYCCDSKNSDDIEHEVLARNDSCCLVECQCPYLDLVEKGYVYNDEENYYYKKETDSKITVETVLQAQIIWTKVEYNKMTILVNI